MNITRDTLVTLLRNMGGRKEVEQYLRHYSSVDSQKFAVIKVGGGILDEQLDTVAAALTYLQQVGLSPMVVHGAGPQLNRALEHAGITTPKINGLRVTPPDALDVVRRVCQQQNLELVAALERHGCGARPIATGVFEAEALDLATLGLVGRVTCVDDSSVVASIRANRLPILTSLATNSHGQLLNVNADEAARALARAFEPHKIIFLTPTGGLLDEHGHILSAINLAEDYSRLMQQSWLTGGMRLKLQQIRDLLYELPETSSVSITSPGQLARELFTHHGAGTLVRRGERVLRHDSFADVDRERLRSLLESCFGRELSASYFDDKNCHRVYVSEEYRATAVVVHEQGLPYLDKFAVTQKAQGEGLGGSLWTRMRQDNPKLFWRSRRTNGVNGWYFQQADGSYQSSEWTVFWCGMDSFAEIERCVQAALELPATLRAHGLSDDNGASKRRHAGQA